MNNSKSKSKHISKLYQASIPPLSRTQEADLAFQVLNGSKTARETLIRANIRYAISYASNFYGHGLSNDDVNCEAVIGLIKAVDHFDPKRGNRLITLSSYYIMNEILRAINKTKPCVSLNAPASEGSENSIQDLLEDSESMSQEQSLISRMEQEKLYSALNKIPENDQELLCMIYGLKNYRTSLSLSEIQERLSVSKQSVFNMKYRALKLLKRIMEEEK